MTKDEAIKTLHELWRTTNDPWYEKVYEMAINALTAQEQLSNNSPEVDNKFGDLISRAAANIALWKALHNYEDKAEKMFLESDDLNIEDWMIHRIFVQNMSDIDRQTILELPSAQPEKRTETHSCDYISRKAAIDADGLDEEIRCEMCENPMHTDRGCDGNCKYDEILYEKIIQILNKRITPLPSAQPIIRCHQCGFWDRDTLQHNFNDFRDWNEAECLVLAERDGYHEINRYTEADDFCSRAERKTDG